MKVVLLQDIPVLGQRGEIKEVSDGYALNYLLPEEKAWVATAYNLSRLPFRKLSAKDLAHSYQQIFKVLNNQVINFHKRVSDKDHLFDAVDTQDIIREVKVKFNCELSGKWFKEPVHIKSLGDHKISLKFPNQVLCQLTVSISKEEIS